FIYAGCEHDFVSMLVAFEEMGVKLNRFDPAEDMHNIRFLLRDSQPASEAKRDVLQFHKRIAKKRSRGLKNPVDAYPGVLLSRLIAGAVVVGAVAVTSSATRSPPRRLPPSSHLASVPPITSSSDDFFCFVCPGDLLFFLRVHALLRGLATRLQVRQRYMEIMAPYA
ncbi:unnamed protein product, partial [Hapterophycus canaliculatus]